MNAGILQRSRRWLLIVVVATLLALTGSSTPLLLDVLTGSALVSPAYACQHHGGGC